MSNKRCIVRNLCKTNHCGDDRELIYPKGGSHSILGDNHLLVEEPKANGFANYQNKKSNTNMES